MPLRSPLPDAWIPDNVDLWQFVQIQAAKYMHRNILISADTGEVISYPAFFDQVARVRTALYRMGLRKGDTLLIFSPNHVHFPVVIMALTSMGAIFTSCSTLYNKDELVRHMRDSKPKMLVTCPDLLPVSKDAMKEYNHIKHTILWGNTVPAGCIPFTKLLNEPADHSLQFQITPKEDTAWLHYSSGTTGVPKGVMLTHYNLMANNIQSMNPAISFDRNNEPDHYITFLPMFHLFATWIFLLAITHGKTMVVMSKFDFQKYLELVQKYKTKALQLVPPVATLLAKHPLVDKYDLSSVEQMLSAAAPLGKDIEQAISERIGIKYIKQGYGMTETSPAQILHTNASLRQGSIGVVIPNTEIKVVDPETGKEITGPNQEGEVWCRGPQNMKGYLNNPEATTKTIDPDGYLHTGDIGYYDEDGYFFITDRCKELIKYKALQIAPASLESDLLTHNAIDDAAVIGVPDSYAGELPKAFVVLKPGMKATEQEIADYIAGRVANYKQLRGGVEFVTEIPKSPSGKILRRVLREREKAKASKPAQKSKL